jgi:stage IV sporulation protein FB
MRWLAARGSDAPNRAAPLTLLGVGPRLAAWETSMLWSLPIGTIAGTVVRLHVTFLLFLVWIGANYWRQGGPEAALDAVLFLVLLFACVLAHEFGHIIAARRYGIRTPEVTLWPIGGVASLERIPDKPGEELVVALAGPAVNVVIALVLIAVQGTALGDAAMTELENPRASLVTRLIAANIFLVVFNMIPAFPMDGGRVLRALIAMRRGQAQATRIAGRIGQVAAFLFALVGLFTNPMLIIIGLFVYLAATAETQHVAFRDGTKGLSVREAMMSKVETLPPTASLDDVVNCLIRTSQKEFPIVDGAGHPRGLVTRDSLIPALRDAGPSTPVLDIMTRDIPAVRGREPLEVALAVLNRAKAPALFITGDDGSFEGLLTPETVGELMLIQSIRPDWRFRMRRSQGSPWTLAQRD